MAFICQQHRKKYENLGDQDLINYWFHWMQGSETPYQNKEWKNALPFVGGAFDLATMLIKRNPDAPLILNLMSLSAIYASNILHHMDREEESDQVILYTQELFLEEKPATLNDSKYFKTLCDESAHNDFVKSHLNMHLYQREYISESLH